jgi:hypothetical protein
MAEEDSYNSHKFDSGAARISSNFQCFICGAIFTTQEDRNNTYKRKNLANYMVDTT